MDEEWEYAALKKTYEWYPMGRLLGEYTSGGAVEKSYTWSVDDRLNSVHLANSNQTIAYEYDHRGSRVRKWERGGTGPNTERRYLSDYENLTGYSQILAETDAAGRRHPARGGRRDSIADSFRAKDFKNQT